MELELTLGREEPRVDILNAIARGPRLHTLSLIGRGDHIIRLLRCILEKEHNAWSNLASLSIKCIGILSVDELPREPRFSVELTQLTLNHSTSKEFLCWLLHGKATLTHLTIITERHLMQHDYLVLPNLRNLQSLTFGRIDWTDHLLQTLHSLNRLKELRFSSAISVGREFPANLPDTIEHMTISIPLFASISVQPNFGAVVLEVPLSTGRPALLKTCDIITIDVGKENGILLKSIPWSKMYGQLAEAGGVAVTYSESNKKSSKIICFHKHFGSIQTDHLIATDQWMRTPFSSARLTGYKVPLYIQVPRQEFHPSGSQLDIRDFEVILGKETGDQKADRVAYRPEPASDTKPFAALRSK